MGYDTTVEKDFADLLKSIDALEPENVKAGKPAVKQEIQDLMKKLKILVREKIGFVN